MSAKGRAATARPFCFLDIAPQFPTKQMTVSSRYTVTMRRSIAILAAALAASAAFTGSALGAAPSFRAVSADGEVVIFSTVEQLVPGDTDTRQDVYARFYDSDVGDYVTREVSIGPIGGNDAYEALFQRASSDGEIVFFSTGERLVAADTDGLRDVYARDLSTGTTELVSAGGTGCLPACGNGDGELAFAGATPDGQLAFFISDESLDPSDTDTTVDVYERDLAADATTLVSAGSSTCAPGCGNGDADAFFLSVSGTGSYAYFGTAEQLASGDTDSADDIYARNLTAGTTSLVSAGSAGCLPGCGNGGAVPVFQSASHDGSRVFFITDEKLGGDTDNATDVYARDLPAGPTSLVSAGTSEDETASFAARSTDGTVAFFTTDEGLAGVDDENEATDIYRWAGGVPQLVTSGTCAQGIGCGSTFNAASSDGGLILFSTTERLTGADTDDNADLYEATAPGWAPVLVSEGTQACSPTCGNGPSPTIYSGLSADGSTALMTTAEQLAPSDVDASADIYARDLDADVTTLASPAGVCPKPVCNSIFSGVSADGTHVIFQTDERLTAEDVDSESDLYERSNGQTRMVSVGNSAVIGPATPVLTGTNPASPGESTTPRIQGQADLGTSIKIYTDAGCVGSPVATGTSLDLGDTGIEVTVGEGTTTSFFATATDADGDTSACSPGISYQQAAAEPPPPSPPPPGEGSGTGSNPSGGTVKPAGSNPKGGGHGGGQVAWVAPQTLITYGPGNKTRKRRPVVQFTDATEQAGTDFFCKVDRRAWNRCASPLKLRKLALGKHVFKVKSRNAVGTWSERAAMLAFKVVR
jgi:hypothetical protein